MRRKTHEAPAAKSDAGEEAVRPGPVDRCGGRSVARRDDPRRAVSAALELHRVVALGCDYFESRESIDQHEKAGTPRVGIGTGCRIENAIIDKNARVGNSVVISPAGKPENFDPRNLDAAGLDRLLAKLDADAQRVYQRASTFLTPNQMKALKTMQEQQRSMAEYGLKMSASMLNGQGKK